MDLTFTNTYQASLCNGLWEFTTRAAVLTRQPTAAANTVLFVAQPQLVHRAEGSGVAGVGLGGYFSQ